MYNDLKIFFKATIKKYQVYLRQNNRMSRHEKYSQYN